MVWFGSGRIKQMLTVLSILPLVSILAKHCTTYTTLLATAITMMDGRIRSCMRVVLSVFYCWSCLVRMLELRTRCDTLINSSRDHAPHHIIVIINIVNPTHLYLPSSPPSIGVASTSQCHRPCGVWRNLAQYSLRV
ncbi:hypothetical protein QBC32DRAFT_50737 [Pseudoneurospora amorphoporcata]|uniref:Uncharacterized protein n=1 Tax=Pseudoneurospora amorphoporcata TaxID=241081 RepID=A0AAN6SD25_9PEZI|nr:hypothetical protein QBC32DRAFT_50737 [Pseudoneurospora amorphoporcata]